MSVFTFEVNLSLRLTNSTFKNIRYKHLLDIYNILGYSKYKIKMYFYNLRILGLNEVAN